MGFLSDQVGSWDFELAGNIGLAEATGRRRIFQSVFQTLRFQGFGIDVCLAFILVMTLFRNGTGRAPGNTLPAFLIPKDKTIFLGVTIYFLTGCQFQKGDNAPDSNRHPLWGDQSVIEAKGPKAAGIGYMALRPGGSPTRFLVP